MRNFLFLLFCFEFSACVSVRDLNPFYSKPVSLVSSSTNTVLLSSLVKDPGPLIESIHSSRPKPTDDQLKQFNLDYLNRKNSYSNQRSTSVQPLASKNIEAAKVLAAAQGLNVNQSLKILTKVTAPQLESLFKEYPQQSCDVPASLSLSLALLSERFYPSDTLFSYSMQSLESAFKCGSPEIKERSAYRLSLFHLSQSHCDKALPYFSYLKSNETDRDFQSRAYYWSSICEKNNGSFEGPVVRLPSEFSGDAAITPETLDFLQRFPNSYQTIRFFESQQAGLKDFIYSQTERPLLYNSQNNTVNTFLYLIESAYLANDLPRVSFLIQKFRSLDEFTTEPEVLIYFSYFSQASKDTISTFNLISKAIHNNHGLKTESVLRFFYPLNYFEQIQKISEKYEIDPYLVVSLIRQESAFNTKAQSRVGARGLMQIMPATGRKLKRGLSKNKLFDIELNLELGVKYLSQLIKKYNGSTYLALAAYNAGLGHVDQWVKRYPVHNPELFVDMIPFQETREYVSAILRNKYWYKALYETPNVKSARVMTIE